MNESCDRIIKIFNKLPNYTKSGKTSVKSSDKLKIINSFVDIIISKNLSIDKLYDHIEYIHKKLSKTSTNISNIRKNIYSSKLNDSYDNLSPLKFSNWLVN